MALTSRGLRGSAPAAPGVGRSSRGRTGGRPGRRLRNTFVATPTAAVRATIGGPAPVAGGAAVAGELATARLADTRHAFAALTEPSSRRAGLPLRAVQGAPGAPFAALAEQSGQADRVFERNTDLRLRARIRPEAAPTAFRAEDSEGPAPGGGRRARNAVRRLAPGLAFLVSALLGGVGCDSGDPAPTPPTAPAPAPTQPPPPCAEACTTEGRVLDFGFYSDYAPLRYSADPEPGSSGFDTHRGYEADLLDALEAMEGAALRFSRKGIGVWTGIWLRAATPDYDFIGGGITILDSRTRDASGEVVVRFTSGHVADRHSLLVRAADASRIAAYDDLDSSVRVGVLAGARGEGRLLRLTGLADEEGVLVAGARLTTATGEVVTDGTAAFTISPSLVSESLRERRALYPPREDLPQVVFHPGDTTVEEMLAALRDGTTDAIARGQIANLGAAAADPTLVVTALDDLAEYGGFAFPVGDTELLACVDEKLRYLADDLRLGYPEWQANAGVFRERAEAWVCAEAATTP